VTLQLDEAQVGGMDKPAVLNDDEQDTPYIYESSDDEEGGDRAEKKAADQQLKLRLLIEHLEPYCNDGSEYEELRKVGRALKDNGDKLNGVVLSGGYTNYSYKLYLEQDPGTAVFAKVAFPYALWSPDQSTHYDLNRQTAEFNLMRRFAKELAEPSAEDGSAAIGHDDAPVPMPYELIDVPSHNVRIFVAQWVAPTDEQWGNQFIEGYVDKRIVTRCARALAQINLADCDEDINHGFVASIHEIAKGYDKIYQDLLQREKVDRTVEHARMLGPARVAEIMKAWHAADESKDCLVHGDAHVFNMLVERKPGVTPGGDANDRFGERGNFFLCDWEMAHKGHKGRDVGTYFSYPFMAAAFLAARGQEDRARDVLDTLPQFWKDYSEVLLTKGGKDREYLTEVFRSAISFYGYFTTLAFYVLGCFRELNETEGLTKEQEEIVVATVGLTGLKSLEMGLLDDVSAGKTLEELEEFLFGMLNQEVQYISESIGSTFRRPSRRRSSVLRATGRRVSDGVSGFGRIERRLSRMSHFETTLLNEIGELV
jgi:hypothetical protein